MSEPGSSRWAYWGRILCAIVSLGILIFILRKVNLSEVAAVLRQMNVGWFLAGLVSFGICLALAAWRWHIVLTILGVLVHGVATLRIVFIGHFFNTLLLGPAGGDFAKSALYGRWYNHRISDVLASSFLDRILGGGGHLIFAALAFGLAIANGLLSEIEVPWLSKRKFWTGTAIALVVFLAAHIFRRRAKANSPVLRTMNTFGSGIRQLWAQPGRAAMGLFLSFMVQATYTGTFAVCLEAVSHEPLPWLKLLWAFPIISLVSGMPITFAGAGVREGASLLLLGLVGVDAADAVAASLLTFFVYMIWTGWGGFLLWREDKLVAARKEQEPPEAVSVVIPVLNEEAVLRKTLAALQRDPVFKQIIVADGGSQDKTKQIADELGAEWVEAPKGRGNQMSVGAKLARHEAILFLHADTQVPPYAGKAIQDCLRDPTVAAGGFWKVFDRPRWLMRGSRLRCVLRLILFRRVMADQGIFVRTKLLNEIGGFPKVALMEEFVFCARIREKGRVALAPAVAVTSTRRFEKYGVLRTYFRMWCATGMYLTGKSPEQIRAFYERE